MEIYIVSVIDGGWEELLEAFSNEEDAKKYMKRLYQKELKRIRRRGITICESASFFTETYAKIADWDYAALSVGTNIYFHVSKVELDLFVNNVKRK